MEIKFLQYAEERFGMGKPEEAAKLGRMAARLNPGSDSLIQTFLTAYAVHIAAGGRTVRGELDHYAILGVDKRAEREAIKKRYKKLALMVHPDKNPSAAAEGAFKLVSQAWEVLSDPTSRRAYDVRCCCSSSSSSRGSRGRGPTPTPTPTTPDMHWGPSQRGPPSSAMGNGWRRFDLSAMGFKHR